MKIVEKIIQHLKYKFLRLYLFFSKKKKNQSSTELSADLKEGNTSANGVYKGCKKIFSAGPD